MTPTIFGHFQDLVLSRGFSESTFTEHEGCVVIANPWPFEIPKNMEQLENVLRAALALEKRTAPTHSK